MITFNEHEYVNTLKKKHRNKSFFKTWLAPSIVLKWIVAPLVLLISAWFSHNFWFSTRLSFGYSAIAWILTIGLSLAIYYSSTLVKNVWVKKERVNFWALLMLVLIGANVCTDIFGVQEIAIQTNSEYKPNMERLQQTDKTFESNKQTYLNQIKSEQANIKANSDWNKNPEKPNWRKHANMKQAKKDLQRMEVSLDKLIQAHTLAREKDMAQIQKEEEIYSSNIAQSLLQFQSGVAICMVIFLGCFLFECWFDSNMFKQTNKQTNTAANTNTNEIWEYLNENPAATVRQIQDALDVKHNQAYKVYKDFHKKHLRVS